MHQYQVTVVDADAPEWPRSRYQGPATVIASTARHARQVLDAEFGVAAEQPGLGSPWAPLSEVNAGIVDVLQIDDPNFDPNGPPRVLDPDPRYV